MPDVEAKGTDTTSTQEQTTPAKEEEKSFLDGDGGEKQEPEPEEKSFLEDDDKTEDGETEQKEEQPDYKDFEMPEGFTADDEFIGEFSKLAKTDKLSQERAQEYVNLAAKLVKESTEKAQAQQSQEWSNLRKAWKNALKQDQEFGGLNLGETKQRCLRVLEKFDLDNEGKPAGQVKDFLAKSGIGDYDAFIRMLARIDKATSDDVIVPAGKPGNAVKTDGDLFYPEMKKGA